MAIVNGDESTVSGDGDDGGGIQIQGGVNVVLTAVSLDANVASDEGGGIHKAGSGTLTINRSTISDNRAQDDGAGIFLAGTSGAVTIDNTTITSNNLLGAGSSSNPTQGVGIYTASSNTVTITNSTIVRNVMFSNVSTSDGGGIYAASGTVTIRNSIVAANDADNGVGEDDCAVGSGTITSNGYNLVGAGTGCPSGGTNDQTINPPDLFQDVLYTNPNSYGGPTNVHILIGKPSNPALDAGDCPSATQDQRGFSRPTDQCDIGAVELRTGEKDEGVNDNLAVNFQCSNESFALGYSKYVLDFSEAADGTTLPRGAIITDSDPGTNLTYEQPYDNITFSTSGGATGLLVILDSSDPVSQPGNYGGTNDGDPDLGTPNGVAVSGGPGVCSGGGSLCSSNAESTTDISGNTVPRGNLLIVQEADDRGNAPLNDPSADVVQVPDDGTGVYSITLEFTGAEPVEVIGAITVDADEDQDATLKFEALDGSGNTIAEGTETACGDNCVSRAPLLPRPGADPTQTRTLVINFDGSGGVEGIIVCSGQPLPVELTSFTGTADGRDVLLRWETAAETNNAGFEVQHQAPEATSFETVTFVDGHGTIELPQRYNHRLEGLKPGPHKFRLRQVDYDGTFEFSPVVEVYVELPDSYVVEPIYPNPFNPQATLRFGVQQEQHVRADLYDVTGRRVKMLYDGTLSAGQFETLTLDGSDLSSGVYFVRVAGETFTETQNVTVMK